MMGLEPGVVLRKIVGLAFFGGGFYLAYFVGVVRSSAAGAIFSVLLCCLGLFVLFMELFYDR